MNVFHRRLLFVKISLLVGLSPLAAQRYYLPSDSSFANPERGFYAMDYRDSTREKSGFELTRKHLLAYRAGTARQVRFAHVSWIRRVYYLDPWVVLPISERFKRQIQSDCDSLRAYGLKMILQFAYGDDSFRANHAPPENRWQHGNRMATRAKILQDIDALTGIFRRNADVIALFQAGWVGQYGEWWGDHTNSPPLGDDYGYRTPRYGHSDTTDQRIILQHYLTAIPSSRSIAIRTPRVKLFLWGMSPITPGTAFDGSEKSRIGHYNDAFQRNWDDAGTYDLLPSHGEKSDTSFLKPWLAKETMYASNGAESFGPLVQGVSDGPSVIAAMKRFHISYQNPEYETTLTDAWRSDGNPSSFGWMDRHMGYRFELVSSLVPHTANRGKEFRLRFQIRNTGTAAPFNPRGLELIFIPQSPNNAPVVINLLRPRQPMVDPRYWLPGELVSVDTTVVLPRTMLRGTYEVMLNLPDPAPSLHDRPAYAIRFANKDVWVPAKGYNSFQERVLVR